MIVPWSVLLVSAINKTQPFLQPYYTDVMVLLYSITFGVAHTVNNTEDWRAKLAATHGLKKLVFFQCLESAVAMPAAFASVYLLFELVIPIWFFYTCLIIAVFGKQFLKYKWRTQMMTLSLG